MKKDCVEIYDLLEDHGMPIEGIFAPYFVTLFLYSTPISVAEKIIDCFLYKGEDFLIEMTIRMLKMKRSKILRFNHYESAAFELQMYLSKQMVEECCADTSIKSILSQSQLSETKSIFGF
uniref:Rab-GAP TBC domain-containing protein n=1 Tax=Euplotes harpa TaxID=151035 RepID=A0A7S3J9A0_9SPIT|mmetsp:Transcript_23849/g.27450  ORF Transcript_23849/g.27450 Transcript_23849/m.27450 type:complete len:120 (+) Transcript_23849:89-448(+)